MTPYFAKTATVRQPVARTRITPSPGPMVVDARSTPAPAEPAPQPVKQTHLLEHPLAQQALTVLRSKDTPPHQFRLNCSQLLALLMIEATRTLPVRAHPVDTGTGTASGQIVAKPVVFLSLARHGLGLAHQVAELFPHLLVGMVSLDRSGDGKSVETRLHLANAPALGDARVILFDPVVASGGSARSALNLLRRSGATDISLISFLVSLPGLSRLQSSHPDLQAWTAGIDVELDAKRGPLPGLGNFAERLYG